MKKLPLFLIVLVLLLAACRGPGAEVSPSPAPTPSGVTWQDSPPPPSASPSPNQDDQSEAEFAHSDPAALQALQAVLLERRDFYYGSSTDRTLLLSDYLALMSRPEIEMSFDCWALCDLDQDGTPEVILNKVYGDNAYVGRLILHYQDGRVYGYDLTYRQLDYLKTDGSFEYNDSAFDVGIGTISFDQAAHMVYHSTVYSRSDYEDSGLRIHYFVDGKETDQAAFDAVFQEQYAKPEALWDGFCDWTVNKIFEDLPVELPCGP